MPGSSWAPTLEAFGPVAAFLEAGTLKVYDIAFPSTGVPHKVLIVVAIVVDPGCVDVSVSEAEGISYSSQANDGSGTNRIAKLNASLIEAARTPSGFDKNVGFMS